MNTLQERLREYGNAPLLFDAADRIDELEGAVHSCHPGCTRAGCVNEKLRGAIEEQRRTIDALMCGMPDDGTTPVIRRIAALEAENAALKADAERYRWLTDDHPKQETRVEVHQIALRFNVSGKGRIDAAIDAARSKT